MTASGGKMIFSGFRVLLQGSILTGQLPHLNAITAVVRHVSTINTVNRPPLQNYIHGEYSSPQDVDRAKDFQVTNPATGEVICMAQSSGVTDVNRAISSAREAFQQWSQYSGTQRAAYLRKAASIMERRLEEIAVLEVTDNGKPIYEARLDIQTAVDSLNYYAGLAPTVSGEHFQLPEGSFGFTRREPLGVVAGIGAWNYPFQIAAWKAAPALAFGNTMVYKPSHFTPVTSPLLAEIFTEAGLPDGCFNVVQGHGETGTLLTSHDDIAKVTFTGSVPTGIKIMRSSAETVKHVTLELGGKSPLIIFDDCHMTNAVSAAMMANFLSQGQVCSNGTRVFVHESIMSEFLSELIPRVKQLVIGDPMCDRTKVGAMVNHTHMNDVLQFVDGAIKEGAELLCGGQRVRLPDPVFEGGCFMSPCVLGRCEDWMTAVREEIFGPVMCVLPFRTEEEVIRRANDSELGLSAGVFTNDLTRAHRTVNRLEAGTVWINNYNIYATEMPFGGYKKSGLGRENGRVTIEHYTQLKSVFVEMNDVQSSL